MFLCGGVCHPQLNRKAPFSEQWPRRDKSYRRRQGGRREAVQTRAYPRYLDIVAALAHAYLYQERSWRILPDDQF